MSIADKLKTIAENEQKVNDKGYLDGWKEGYMHEKFSDRFWELYTKKGARTDFEGAFYHWSARQYGNGTHYNMTASGSAFECFRGFNNAGLNGKEYIPNFTMHAFRVAGNTYKGIDFQYVTNAQHMFMQAVIHTLNGLDLRSALYAERAFYYSEIVNLTSFKFPSKAVVDHMFDGATELTNVTLPETIVNGKNINIITQNNIDLHWSTKLTHASLLQFLNALEDKTKDASGTEWKFIIGSTNLSKLSSAEKAIAKKKGWILE